MTEGHKRVHEKNGNKSPIFIISDKEIIADKQFNFIIPNKESNMMIRDLADMYNLGDICYLLYVVFQFQTFAYVVIAIRTSIYFYRYPKEDSDESVHFTVIYAINW